MAAKVVFLLYDSRSGSTLFSALLNRYQSICVSQESAFIARIIEYKRELESEADAGLLINKLMEEVQFFELGLSRADLVDELREFNFPVSKSAIAHAILNLYFPHRDPAASIWVVKHNPYRHIQTLRSMFPGVRFLHIVRDGRAVYHSRRNSHSLNGEPMDVNLLKAALRWRQRMLTARRNAQKYPGLVFELRYEDLVTVPEAVLEKVLDYLDVSPDGRRLTKSQREYYLAIGERQKHLHANVGKEPDRQIAEGWKRGLDAVDLYLYEKIDGKLLVSYGYPLLEAGKPHWSGFYFQAVRRFTFYLCQYMYMEFLKMARGGWRRLSRLHFANGRGYFQP